VDQFPDVYNRFSSIFSVSYVHGLGMEKAPLLAAYSASQNLMRICFGVTSSGVCGGLNIQLDTADGSPVR
jgi:hypothetical protein